MSCFLPNHMFSCYISGETAGCPRASRNAIVPQSVRLLLSNEVPLCLPCISNLNGSSNDFRPHTSSALQTKHKSSH